MSKKKVRCKVCKTTCSIYKTCTVKKEMMKSEKGFTLIELLVVVAILGILATIALPNIIGMLAKGDEVKAEAETATVQTAADAYAVDTGSVYPAGTINMADLEQWLRKTPNGTFTIDDKGTVTRAE